MSRQTFLLRPLFVSLSAERKQGVGSYQRDPPGCLSFPLSTSAAVEPEYQAAKPASSFLFSADLNDLHGLSALLSLTLAHISRDGQIKDEEGGVVVLQR